MATQSITKQFGFSPEIVEEINCQRYNHLVALIGCDPFQSIWNVVQGNCGDNKVTENTLRDYFGLYKQGGIEKLKRDTLLSA